MTSRARAGPLLTVRRTLRRLVLVGGLLGVALGLALLGYRSARPGVLPNTYIAGVDVGGTSEAELAAAVDDLAQRRADAVLTVRAPTSPAGQGDASTVSATAAELGYTLDRGATVRAAWTRGRQANPLAALIDHLHASFGALTVPPAAAVDRRALDAWMEQAADALESDQTPGGVRFEGTEVVAVQPAPGVRIVRDELGDRLAAGAMSGGGAEITAPVDRIAPRTTAEDVDRVADAARQAVSAPVVLTRPGAALTLTPQEIAAVLTTEVVEQDGDPSLRLVASPERLQEMLGADRIAALKAEPVDARFDVTAQPVRVVPSSDGFRFDRDKAAQQLVELATGSGAREAVLEGESVPPALTTEQAQALEIVEEVSAFTTHYRAGRSRVTNIHRMAEMVDGVVVHPTTAFSLNDYIGPRTREKGFVGGGAIFDGEFVEQVGGGVSQFATTFFNAAYFGGYELVDYKPHSYYISRYPMGREATINYPTVDLKIRNNSPHGILIRTSVTDTSVTVTFYGKKWVEVESVTGEPHNYRGPETRVRENPALPPGSERVVQSGRRGFDVHVVRILRFPDGHTDRQRLFTRYLPEPRIIERGPAQAAPAPGETSSSEEAA